jgi:hypothetical protein
MCSLPALVRVFGQTGLHHAIEGWWGQWLEGTDRRGLGAYDGRDKASSRSTAECGSPGAQWKSTSGTRVETDCSTSSFRLFTLRTGYSCVVPPLVPDFLSLTLSRLLAQGQAGLERVDRATFTTPQV